MTLTSSISIALYIFKKFFIYLLLHFWLCWVFTAARGLSLAVVSRPTLSSAAVRGLLIAVAFLTAGHGL